MPTYEITIVRKSVLRIDAASPEAVQGLLKMMPVPVLDMAVGEVKTTTEVLPADAKGRWVFLDGKLMLQPIQVPDRAALKLVGGDYQNDIAVVAGKEGFIFLRGTTLGFKPDLLGALAPHVMQGDAVMGPFDDKHMVESKGGIWATQAIMQEVAKMNGG